VSRNLMVEICGICPSLLMENSGHGFLILPLNTCLVSNFVTSVTAANKFNSPYMFDLKKSYEIKSVTL
jgi:hypothetical protein